MMTPYSEQEVLQYMAEEDVKFIRLAFCDVFGRQKNISIMPGEVHRAFETGVAFDASSIAGFGDEQRSDLLLFPEPDTVTALPWRPEHGRVVRMNAAVRYPDGRPFEADTRALLKNAVLRAEKKGYSFRFGAEQEFYLFCLDENGGPTGIPCDNAGYMDIAPEDRGENVRREVCLTLEQMGVLPESSHHEEGPGQNEIDFRYADPLKAADQAQLFQTTVKTVAHRGGYHADFSPKPMTGAPGNGFHINLSVAAADGSDVLPAAMAGVLAHVQEMTAFLNPTEESYRRLGRNKAPGFVSWSRQNRSQLIRIPAGEGELRRMELRSPDPGANPYLAFTLMIAAAMDGIERGLTPPPAADINLFKADSETLSRFQRLPGSLTHAKRVAGESVFLRGVLPNAVISPYCKL